jgi:hypothetical protein
VKEEKLKEEMMLRQFPTANWRSAKRFTQGRRQLVALGMPRYTGGFLITDLNNSFYALSHVELWKRSQKIVGNFRRVWRYQTSQCVRVMPDFKAIVFVEGQLPFIVATPPRRKIGL